jgi:hypothetical protein
MFAVSRLAQGWLGYYSRQGSGDDGKNWPIDQNAQLTVDFRKSRTDERDKDNVVPEVQVQDLRECW